MQRFIIVGAVIAIAIVKIVWLKPTNEENKIKDRQTNRQTDMKDRRFWIPMRRPPIFQRNFD